jgi:hypothetical protein
MAAPQAEQWPDSTDGEHELAQDAGGRETAAHPDQVGPRGNPDIEQIDVERGLDKIDRVSGN